MATKKTPKQLTADDVRAAVRGVQHARRGCPYRCGGGALAEWRRLAERARRAGEKVLTGAGLDEYGYPPGTVLSPAERAVRVLDDVERLPRREQCAATVDGFETLDGYIARVILDATWTKRAPLIRAAALRGDSAALKVLASDAWAGWDPAVRDGWQALKADAELAQRLDAAGITPDFLVPLVVALRRGEERERGNVIASVTWALRYGAGAR